MKKSGIINAELSKLIAGLGHTDKFIICDGGLPLPWDMHVVDLALCGGVPTFKQVYDAVMNEVATEYYFLSEDIQEKNVPILELIKSGMPGIDFKYLKHTDFKEMSKTVKFAIRTGEFTPFANVIITAGVAFKV